jgi:hypothetical protein
LSSRSGSRRHTNWAARSPNPKAGFCSREIGHATFTTSRYPMPGLPSAQSPPRLLCLPRGGCGGNLGRIAQKSTENKELNSCFLRAILPKFHMQDSSLIPTHRVTNGPLSKRKRAARTVCFLTSVWHISSAGSASGVREPGARPMRTAARENLPDR